MPQVRGALTGPRSMVPRLRPKAARFPKTPEYRADGWPLCPQCGEDELASVRATETLRGPKLLEARQALLEEYIERHGVAMAKWPPAVRLAYGKAWSEAASRRPKPTDEMKCYACRWGGCVSPRAEFGTTPASRRGQ